MFLTEKSFNHIIDTINMLGIEADKIIITGSVALCAYGLKREFNDVDIIVINPTRGSWSDFLSEYGEKDTESTYERVKVGKAGLEIDILKDNYVALDPVVSIGMGFSQEYYLDRLENIIAAKHGCNRQKDMNDFSEMISTITNLCE